jgi:hypothetical protein
MSFRTPYDDALEETLHPSFLRADEPDPEDDQLTSDELEYMGDALEWARENWDGLSDESRDFAIDMEQAVEEGELALRARDKARAAIEDIEERGYSAETFRDLVSRYKDDPESAIELATSGVEYIGVERPDDSLDAMLGQFVRRNQITKGGGEA